MKEMNQKAYKNLVRVINAMLIDITNDGLKDEADYMLKLYNSDYNYIHGYATYCKLILKGHKYADLKYLYSLRDLIIFDMRLGDFNEDI